MSTRGVRGRERKRERERERERERKKEREREKCNGGMRAVATTVKAAGFYTA
jgi:hypothetical protein